MEAMSSFCYLMQFKSILAQCQWSTSPFIMERSGGHEQVKKKCNGCRWSIDNTNVRMPSMIFPWFGGSICGWSDVALSPFIAFVAITPLSEDCCCCYCYCYCRCCPTKRNKTPVFCLFLFCSASRRHRLLFDLLVPSPRIGKEGRKEEGRKEKRRKEERRRKEDGQERLPICELLRDCKWCVKSLGFSGPAVAEI